MRSGRVMLEPRRWGLLLPWILLAACAPVPDPVPPEWELHQAAHPDPTAAYRWMEILQEAAGRSVERHGPRPTITSREMAIVATAMYDAWAAYDGRAVGTRWGGRLRRPAAERSLERQSRAVAAAAHRALVHLYPEDRSWLDGCLRQEGVDPAGQPPDPAAPLGVGIAAADALIRYRRSDGANESGGEPGGNGRPYSDTTGYRPVNPRDRVLDPDRWQELPFDDGRGGVTHVPFLTPHWYRVKPFLLERADQFRPGPPPKVGEPRMDRELETLIRLNGSLSLEEKAVVEFMRDGPRSTGQSGHWLHLAADVSRRDRHGLEQDVKLFFVVANVVFDAFISCWEAKRHYDTSRPWTLIRHLYRGRMIRGYLGPCRGFGEIPGELWHTYSPSTFVTPPFPGYPSGHAAASGAAARTLELLTGSDRFGSAARVRVGALTEPGCGIAQMRTFSGEPWAAGEDGRVLLRMDTFSATAEMAARSRALGGYHIPADNEAGLEAGRALATWSWPRYLAYFDGSAGVRD